ncbi:MAG: hypothetical protein Q7P63_13765 [Verrucomicrobiota bacterium JB022]|nr:hypothetical protein [Verrucomicrobiota bacterium JB022]
MLTADPEPDYIRTVEALKQLRDENPGVAFVASNQAIGEAYIVLQKFYQISKQVARESLFKVLSRSSISPQNGQPVLDLLREKGGCGLMDRLIAQGYAQVGATILTNDRKMAQLPNARLLF